MSNISNSTQKNHRKTIVTVIMTMAIFVSIIIYFGLIKPAQHPHLKDVKIDGIVLIPTKDISDFQLTDSQGKIFTKDSLKNHWTMMFFGFSNCGMVCPSTMAALNKMYLTLQKQLPDNQLPNIVMVSVDPERDTVTKMNNYVTMFNSHFLGARGEAAETVRLEKEFHIVAVRIQQGNDKNNYYFDHSAEILLINPDAKIQAYLSYPHTPEQMVKDYKSVLSAAS